MRWDPGHRSNDVIDRRGQRASGIGGGGGGAGLGLLLMLVRSRFGWAGVAVLLVGYFVLTSFTGVLDSSAPVLAFTVWATSLIFVPSAHSETKEPVHRPTM